MTTSLGHTPSGSAWAFDASVTDCFEDMLRRSIPELPALRALVSALVVKRYRTEGAIVDLGCSRGDMTALLAAALPAASFLAVDVSSPMLDVCRERFASIPRRVEVRALDIREQYPERPASVTLLILTLQFIPIEYRQRLLSRLFAQTLPGGSVILVEKVLGSTDDMNSLLVETYYDRKEANGYSREEIDTKRRSLEGVLVPLTSQWNEELLRGAGFVEVECFWRWGNFAGWLATRR